MGIKYLNTLTVIRTCIGKRRIYHIRPKLMKYIN